MADYKVQQSMRGMCRNYEFTDVQDEEKELLLDPDDLYDLLMEQQDQMYSDINGEKSHESTQI